MKKSQISNLKSRISELRAEIDNLKSEIPNPQSACAGTNARNPQSKIRLTHCIGSMITGGAEGQLAELICRLPPERFEQSLVLLQGGGGPLLERVRAAGCQVLDLRYRQCYRKIDPRSLIDLLGALGRFVRHLRAFRPHLLHAHLSWANILSVAAGRLARVPFIIIARRQLGDYKQGKPVMQRLENWASRHTGAMLVNSEAVRRDVLAHDCVAPAKIRRIYNGVALGRFDPIDPAPLRRELGLAPADLVLLVVANLHPYKGHDDLLRAAASLRARFPSLRLLFPGRDQGMRARLDQLIAELNLSGCVQFLGDRKDIPALLAVADLVVHPSHQEGFSNSILEAMAAARPLVVTAVGGNPEAVRDGQDGFVIPPRDPAALAAALEKLLADPSLRRAMGQSARRRIEEEFSMEKMIERTAAWYESLAAR